LFEKNTFEDYSEEQTKTVRTALIEVGEALQPYYEDIVLVGGWVPYLLTEDSSFHHCGTEDIDLAVRRDIPNRGKTIREIVEGLSDKKEVSFPNRLSIGKETDGKKHSVRLEFMCQGENVKEYLPVQKDLKAAPFPSIGVAFDFNSKMTISNGTRATNLKVADLVASFVMKSNYGSYVVERDPYATRENRQLYDIFALTWYKGGPSEAAKYFKQVVSRKISDGTISSTTIKQIKDAVERIYNAFNRDSGIWGVVSVQTFDKSYDDPNFIRERMKLFLEPVRAFLNEVDL
jgi:hypothetical protein